MQLHPRFSRISHIPEKVFKECTYTTQGGEADEEVVQEVMSQTRKGDILREGVSADSPVRFRRLTAVLKPTHACNLACTYCYVFDRSSYTAMTDEVLNRTTAALFKLVRPGGELVLLWHGGEPSLQSVSFYEKALLYQRNSRIRVKNIFQTNGYYVEDRLLRFLADNNFSVGVSLDGPAHLHDRCRITRDGRGTFAKVIDTIHRMKSLNIPFGAVCVITKQNKDHTREIYDFFHTEQIPFRINPLINAGAAKENPIYHHITPEEYTEVVLEFFRLWYEDTSSTLRVATVEDIIKSIMTGVHTGCHDAPNCQENFLSIGPSGDVYPCGRFEGRPSYCYGNVIEDSLSSILESSVRTRLLERSAETIPGCGECKWLKICNGGCMHNALEDTGDIMNRDILCRAYKRIYAEIEETLQETLQVVITPKENSR